MDIKKRLIIIWLMMLVLVIACVGGTGTTNIEVTESPAQNPTEIPTDIPTEVPAEVPTEAMPTATVETVDEVESTPEEVAPVRLLDTEEMIKRLGDYVLRPEDLPHSYTLQEGGELHKTTLRLINEMGEIEAKTYVRDTGRIDGWWLRLRRESKEDFAPGAFESSVELFESPAGAQIAMTPDYNQMYQDESREYLSVEGGCDLGDDCEFYYSEKKDPETEIVTAQYNIAFTYKNALAWVMARGLTVDLDADYVLAAARSVLAKLESAPTK